MTWDSAFLSETDVWSKVLGEPQAASQFQHIERSLKLGGFICDIRVDDLRLGDLGGDSS